jgi:hypothetical protein
LLSESVVVLKSRIVCPELLTLNPLPFVDVFETVRFMQATVLFQRIPTVAFLEYEPSVMFIVEFVLVCPYGVTFFESFVWGIKSKLENGVLNTTEKLLQKAFTMYVVEVVALFVVTLYVIVPL